jgi:hypothetical protein
VTEAQAETLTVGVSRAVALPEKVLEAEPLEEPVVELLAVAVPPPSTVPVGVGV